MDKLEFTNRNIENLNRCISNKGKVELMKYVELSNRLYEAINYKRCSTELCEHTGDETLHQGNGFVYKTCADCGEEI